MRLDLGVRSAVHGRVDHSSRCTVIGENAGKHTYSSISFGLFPAASMRVGFSISFGMLESIPPREAERQG